MGRWSALLFSFDSSPELTAIDCDSLSGYLIFAFRLDITLLILMRHVYLGFHLASEVG
jgi:hypothetical protein